MPKKSAPPPSSVSPGGSGDEKATSPVTWAVPATAKGPPEPTARRYTTDKDWEKHKPRILELRKNGVRLTDIRRIIEREAGFAASEAQYKRRFEVWGDKKKLTRAQRRYMIQQMQKQGKILKFQRVGGGTIEDHRVKAVWDNRHKEDVPTDKPISPEGIFAVTMEDVRPETEEIPVISSATSAHAGPTKDFGQWLLDYLEVSEQYEYDEVFEDAATASCRVQMPMLDFEQCYKEALDGLVATFVSSYTDDSRYFDALTFGLSPPPLSSRHILESKPLAQLQTAETVVPQATEDGSFPCPVLEIIRNNKIMYDSHETFFDDLFGPRPTTPTSIGSPGSSIASHETGSRSQYSSSSWDSGLGGNDPWETSSFGSRRDSEEVHEMFGYDSRYNLESRMRMAKGLEANYRFNEAEAVYLDTCKRLENAFGLTNTTTRKALLIVGRFYRKHLRFDQAWEPLWKVAAAGLSTNRQPDSYNYGAQEHEEDLDDISRSALMLVLEMYSVQGDHARAVRLGEALYTCNLRSHGKDSKECFDTLERLGWALVNDRRFDEALERFHEAKRIASGISEARAMDINFYINRISVLTGRAPSNTEDMFLLDLAIREKRYPHMVHNLCTNLQGIANFHAARKNYNKSIGYYERCLVTLRNTYGKDHPQTLCIVNTLVGVLAARGMVMYARPLSHYVLKRVEKLYGPLHLEVLQAILNASNLSYAASTGEPSGWQISEVC